MVSGGKGRGVGGSGVVREGVAVGLGELQRSEGRGGEVVRQEAAHEGRDGVVVRGAEGVASILPKLCPATAFRALVYLRRVAFYPSGILVRLVSP